MRIESLKTQSRLRHALNGLGIVFLVLVFLELLLRGVGFLLTSQTLQAVRFPSQTSQPVSTMLCIGDSWTAGRKTGSYPADLQSELNRLQTGRTYRVVNLGQPGMNSSQGLRRLSEALPTYKPEIVIVMIGNNDHWNLSESAYWQFANQRLNALSVLAARARVFLHSLRVFKFFTVIYLKATARPTLNEFYIATPDEPAGGQLIVIDRATHHRQLEYNLIRCVEMSRTNGFALVFQTYFHFHGYDVNEIIRDVASRYRVPLVDNNLLFHTRVPLTSRETYLIPDRHPSPLGYEFIAANILEVLRDARLVPAK